jgi:hypothetical protein
MIGSQLIGILVDVKKRLMAFRQAVIGYFLRAISGGCAPTCLALLYFSVRPLSVFDRWKI